MKARYLISYLNDTLCYGALSHFHNVILRQAEDDLLLHSTT